MVTPEWLTGTKSLPCKEVINDVFISFNSIFLVRYEMCSL